MICLLLGYSLFTRISMTILVAHDLTRIIIWHQRSTANGTRIGDNAHVAARACDGHIEATIFAQKADDALRVRANQRENCARVQVCVCECVRVHVSV